MPSAEILEQWVIDARSRTLAMVHDLSDEQLRVPLLRIINPFIWEIGHVAYFQEYWVLRHVAGRTPIRADADALYDSAKVAHDTRWNLPLPSRVETLDYLEEVRDRVLDRIARQDLDEEDLYFILLSVFHEDMHDEALTITRQTLSYPAPAFSEESAPAKGSDSSPLPGSVEIPEASYVIGSVPEDGFIFDNEKWAHPVHIKSFRMARAPVTQSEFLAFIEDGGYQRRELWSLEGWTWRTRENATHPIYWRRDAERDWMRRHFDSWVPLEPHRPVANVCWFEADAYCRWARKRLPTEHEWEIAARGRERLIYPWGNQRPETASANLDWAANGCCDVNSRGAGDSIYGCRQMIGNVWEWTANEFLPYPGFSEDPYREYSSPWFGTHKSLRGGAWPTRSRLIRSAYRNFYTPDRRDIWAGFRTCELEQ